MARRKPPSCKPNSSRNVLAVSGQQQREQQHLFGSRDSSAAAMHTIGSDDGPSENRPREQLVAARAADNNNDSRYLHKKFKKMASVDLSSTQPHHHRPPSVNGDDAAVQVDIPSSSPSDLTTTVASRDGSLSTSSSTNGGRHVCPYCKLSCAKPSVLQKHIRAHTNERPYPCVPCGFSFKTKSNLYKHCRSRSHALRLNGSEELPPTNEEDWSLGSSAEAKEVSSEGGSTSDSASSSEAGNGMTPNAGNSDGRPNNNKSIYKPKFHKASLYQEEDGEKHPQRQQQQPPPLSPNADSINRHISKIISQNEAIVETLDAPFHRKYNKEAVNSRLASVEYKQDHHQPLNLTKESADSSKKRRFSDSFNLPISLVVPQHPLNPERSIIKDLLLKARAQAAGLVPLTSETYEAPETLYVCRLCQISFRSEDNLEIHSRYYCKGVTNGYAIEGKHSRTEYIRSNSVNAMLPERYSPSNNNSPSKGSVRRDTKRHKPENLVLHRSDSIEVSAPLPSPGPLLGHTRLVDSASDHHRSRLSVDSGSEKSTRLSPMMSMKRRSESQSSEGTSSISKYSEEMYSSPPSKMRCAETPATLRSLEELSLSPMRPNATSLQMFGGEVKILDNAGGSTTMRIEPTTSQHSPTMISQSRASPSAMLQAQPETSSILVRSGLHSGATIVHNPPTPKEPLPSPHPQTPRLMVSIAPNISTPTLSVAGISAANMSKFQFPIGPITAFNPLTLPPLSPVSPCGATTILHGGKLIPYVPGMPGPNTPLNVYSSLQKNSRGNGEVNSDFTLSKSWKDKQRNMFNGESSHSQKYSTIGVKSSPSMNMRKEFIGKSNNNTAPKTVTASMNYEDSVIVKSSYSSDTQSKQQRSAQVIMIDELLRKNSEILQKSSTGDIDCFTNAHRTLSPMKSRKPSEDFADPRSTLLLKTVDRERKNGLSFETRQFNFENLISKSEIPIKQAAELLLDQTRTNPTDEKSAKSPEQRSETSYFKKTNSTSSVPPTTIKNDSQKFLRPSSLSLKPGTFTPKRHHGITPSANTLPLISPETPRPAKAYGQLYLNGHAYTYLGLKCSTKVYYCTLNKPQPTYVPNQHSLSMYSNWQVCLDSAPHPLGLSPGQAMSEYDSRHRPQNFTVSKIKQEHIMTHSSQWTTKSVNQAPAQSEADMNDESKTSNNEASATANKSRNLTGGFESNEEYTYVRGRGRGRYVCSECGIRCKKPSMLKKHIRTHTDVRPFTCKHCAFSFKTKGNLTKHMKSKAHFRKCNELGVSPLDGLEGTDMSQGLGESDDDSDTEDDGNDGETESSDTDSCKSRLEHEAAHCLLSLSTRRPAPGLLTTARPTTYPYAPNHSDAPPPSTTQDDAKFLGPSTKELRKSSPNRLGLKLDKTKRPNSVPYPMDLSKPIDLSKGEAKETPTPKYMHSAEEILTPVGEPDFLASLSMSADKLPVSKNHWNDDAPMFQAYLKEKALQDSRIKQCQYTNGKLKQHEFDSSYTNAGNSTTHVEVLFDNSYHRANLNSVKDSVKTVPSIVVQPPSKSENMVLSDMQVNDNLGIQTLAEIAANSVRLATPPISGNSSEKKIATTEKLSNNNENAKLVASVYLKSVCGKSTEVKLDKPDNIRINSSDESSIPEKEKLNSEHLGIARKVVVGADGVGFKLSGDFPSQVAFSKAQITEDGRSVCVVCNKSFSKPSQLRLHINIHYIERPYRCSACAISFRTRGHLQKHERSGSHHNKVSMTSTFGAATTTNPRPFKCSDCKIAFRIHGHLAKHLRSKMHVMRLECLGKLPFGTFAEIERAGVSLTDIDTTDCDHSLASLRTLAQKLHERDPTKLEKWIPAEEMDGDSCGEEDPTMSPGGEHRNLNDGAEELCKI